MERRRETRLRTNQEVMITVLGKHRTQMQGKNMDLSGCGMRVAVPDRVSPGDAVKVDMDDALLLGEVCYCRRHESGFILGIELDQALSGLADLKRLNDSLLDDAERLPAAEAVHVTEARYPTRK